MSEITEILSQAQGGSPLATRQLFQLVYEDLRRLAASKMLNESHDQTLQPTALVHDAFMRLVDGNSPVEWENRGHFFAAAAEAMRRILIEAARRRQADKRGGGWNRVELIDLPNHASHLPEELLAVDESLETLAREDAVSAELVKLRLFAGLSITEAGKLLGLPRSTAYETWNFARAWFASRDS